MGPEPRLQGDVERGRIAELVAFLAGEPDPRRDILVIHDKPEVALAIRHGNLRGGIIGGSKPVTPTCDNAVFVLHRKRKVVDDCVGGEARWIGLPRGSVSRRGHRIRWRRPGRNPLRPDPRGDPAGPAESHAAHHKERARNMRTCRSTRQATAVLQKGSPIHASLQLWMPTTSPSLENREHYLFLRWQQIYCNPCVGPLQGNQRQRAIVNEQRCPL